VVKPEWGIKRICPNCGTRYYDFRKSPPVCPACSTVYDPDALLKSRRVRSGAVEEVRKPAKGVPVEDVEEIAPDVDDADAADTDTADDDALIEDTDDLDGGDLSAEVEVEENDEDR
jgi:uncharacterized protein (TIGR02300 family)